MARNDRTFRALAAMLALAVASSLLGDGLALAQVTGTQRPGRATAPETAGGSAPSPAVRDVLQRIKKADADLLAVSEADGQFLQLMVTTSRATRALEIGGAHGFSAIWIGLGLRRTGGRLTTIEYDPVRAAALSANIRAAGLSDIVTVIAGDAFAHIPTLAGPVDFVFLDAWKRDYRRFFDLLLPRLVPGGLFLAHNVVNKRTEMPDFLDAIWKHPQVMTSIVAPSGEGMSVSVKLK